jgi:rare lipoprotein A
MKPGCAVAGLLLAAALLTPAGASERAATQRPAAGREASTAPAEATSAPRRPPQRQVGKASYYHPRFHGRPMADGTRMRPESNNAASKTLPLGTKARVTNLETGQSAQVEIRDRGPFVKGRIVDLSPRTAREIGLDKEEGLARVEVVPLELPPEEGPAR